MRELKGQNLNDRLGQAAKAKQAMLEKFRARPGEDDPAVIKLRAEQKAITEARRVREAEKAERKAKEKAEREAREAAEKAERKVKERRAAIEKLIRDAAEASERQAALRAAARKARKKS